MFSLRCLLSSSLTFLRSLKVLNLSGKNVNPSKCPIAVCICTSPFLLLGSLWVCSMDLLWSFPKIFPGSPHLITPFVYPKVKLMTICISEIQMPHNYLVSEPIYEWNTHLQSKLICFFLKKKMSIGSKHLYQSPSWLCPAHFINLPIRTNSFKKHGHDSGFIILDSTGFL